MFRPCLPNPYSGYKYKELKTEKENEIIVKCPWCKGTGHGDFVNSTYCGLCEGAGKLVVEKDVT